MLDHSAGVVISVFAPHPFDEFSRVLRPDGWWVTVTPGPCHLQEMRPEARSESATKIEQRMQRRSLPPPDATSAVRVQFNLDLSAEAAHDLFLMTPIRWQAGDRVDGPASVSVDVWVSSSRAG